MKRCSGTSLRDKYNNRIHDSNKMFTVQGQPYGKSVIIGFTTVTICSGTTLRNMCDNRIHDSDKMFRDNPTG